MIQEQPSTRPICNEKVAGLPTVALAAGSFGVAA